MMATGEKIVPMATVEVEGVATAMHNRGAPTGEYGTDPCIGTADPRFINIIYRAEFDYFCCDCIGNIATCASLMSVTGGNDCMCPCVDRSRYYLQVHENAVEKNVPIGLCSTLCWTKSDMVMKQYFDRGVYDQQGCARSMGCIRGAPVAFANEVTYVCCCADCPSCMNQCMSCHCASCCGERVRVLPYEQYCCCCPARSCFLNNCCGLCGPKTGEPLLLMHFARSLRIGTGQALAEQMEYARAAWKARTGHA